MNTRYLKEYLSFAEELNYSVAAKKLFITRPTLTEHLHELEAELGCKLVEKNEGQVGLTHVGKKFVKTATEILSYIDEVVEEYSKMEQNLIVVTVASTNLPWLETVLYKARRSIHEQYPKKQVDIVTVNGPFSTIDALFEHGNDIAIAGFKSYVPGGEELLMPEGVEGFKLQTEEIRLLMTQENLLFDKEAISASDLDGATVILPPDIYEGYLRDKVTERFLKQGASIKLVSGQFNDHFEYFSNDFEDMIRVVPTTLIRRFGLDEREECRVFSLVDLPLHTEFYVVYKEGFGKTENGQLLISEIRSTLEGSVD